VLLSGGSGRFETIVAEVRVRGIWTKGHLGQLGEINFPSSLVKQSKQQSYLDRGFGLGLARESEYPAVAAHAGGTTKIWP
jgi:hypothetical protein